MKKTSFWSKEGLAWRQFTEAKHPAFWRWHNGWRLRLMTEEIAMAWDWPAEVTIMKRKLFCEWKTLETGQQIRMPTEDEWHRLCSQAGVEELGNSAANANLHLDHFASCCPVTRYQHGNWYDVVGNVWQWTETPIYPFDNFKVHPLYDDFTTPTFDGKHNLIKGGSWISSGKRSGVLGRVMHLGVTLLSTLDFAILPLKLRQHLLRLTTKVISYCQNMQNFTLVTPGME